MSSSPHSAVCVLCSSKLNTSERQDYGFMCYQCSTTAIASAGTTTGDPFPSADTKELVAALGNVDLGVVPLELVQWLCAIDVVARDTLGTTEVAEARMRAALSFMARSPPESVVDTIRHPLAKLLKAHGYMGAACVVRDAVTAVSAQATLELGLEANSRNWSVPLPKFLGSEAVADLYHDLSLIPGVKVHNSGVDSYTVQAGTVSLESDCDLLREIEARVPRLDIKLVCVQNPPEFARFWSVLLGKLVSVTKEATGHLKWKYGQQNALRVSIPCASTDTIYMLKRIHQSTLHNYYHSASSTPSSIGDLKSVSGKKLAFPATWKTKDTYGYHIWDSPTSIKMFGVDANTPVKPSLDAHIVIEFKANFEEESVQVESMQYVPPPGVTYYVAQPPGKNYVLFHTPYNSSFVTAVKSIPTKSRKWVPSSASWVVDAMYATNLMQLASKLYGSKVTFLVS